MGVSPNDLKVRSVRMLNKIIRPSEDLRGRYLYGCLIPKMNDSRLLDGVVIYNSYVTPQTLNKSCLVLEPRGYIDAAALIYEFAELDGYAAEFDSFHFKFAADSVEDSIYEYQDYLDFEDYTFTNCVFDFESVTVGVDFIKNKLTDVKVENFSSNVSFSECAIRGSLDVSSTKPESAASFHYCSFSTADTDLSIHSKVVNFLQCLSNASLGRFGSASACLILKDKTSVVDQIGANERYYHTRSNFDWSVQYADLRNLHLGVSEDCSVSGANFKGSIFGGASSNEDRISTVFAFRGSSYQKYYDIDKEENIDFECLFKGVNFSEALLDSFLIHRATSYFSGLRKYGLGKLPAFEKCDFSNACLGFIAYVEDIDYRNTRFVPELDPKSVKFKNCNFEGCVSLTRKEVAKKGGYYLGPKSDYNNINLSNRKLLGRDFSLSSVVNSDFSNCNWFSDISMFKSNFEGCDFSKLKMDRFAFDLNEIHLQAIKSNLNGCVFRGLPKGFTMQFKDCKMENTEFDSNTERYVDDLGYTVIRVI